MPTPREETWPHCLKNSIAAPPGGSSVVYTRLSGSNATLYNVMSQVLETEYDILHYAGHAFFDPANPAASGWIFGFENGETDRTVLSSRELRLIDRLPPFVFSNACESGVTPARPEGRSGDFAPSFAEAFFERGLSNFVCTAWPISDQAARRFALAFYSSMLGMTLSDEGEPFRVAGTKDPARMFEATGRSPPGTLGILGRPPDMGLLPALWQPLQPFPSREFPVATTPGPAEAGHGNQPGHDQGQLAGMRPGSRPASAKVDYSKTAIDATESAGKSFEEIRRVIGAHRDRLMAIAGVVDLRPGFKYTDGWSTGEHALVVVVENKIKPAGDIPARARIPATLDGVPTDVTPMTPSEQLRRESIEARGARAAPELEDLIYPGEQPSIVADDEEIADRSLVQYQPPDGVPLEAIDDQMTVNCHLSPDNGWPTLSDFIDGVNKSLTVAMYDFSAPHIVSQLKRKLRPSQRTLDLVLDPALSLTNGGGADNPKSEDIDEEAIVEELASALGQHRFRFTWAAVKRTGKVSQGIFPRAYHIKVAVRDGQAFWLSSGNWQSSNQPPEDVVPRDMDREINRPSIWTKYNREWHVVIEHQGLAETFREYIESDFAQAEPLQSDQRGLPFDDLEPWLLVPLDDDDRRPREVDWIEPLVVSRSVRVMPVLTPDNYPKQVLELIESARSTLYFQNQYIAISKKIPQAFSELIDALLDRAQCSGRASA